MYNDKISLLGLGVDNVSMLDAIDSIEKAIVANKNSVVAFLNVDVIVKAQAESFKRILQRCNLLLADGTPLLWAATFLGKPLKEKVSGSDLFPILCEVAANKGYRLFFLGGREDAALKTSYVLQQKYPGINIVGIYSPPFGFENNAEENSKILNMIRDSKPDILFVGLGAPKQEKWMFEHKDNYKVPVSISVGATFEFIAGMAKRAPNWMQKSGLEWFWRLMIEPRRLWKRYLIDDPIFFWLVFKQKMGWFKAQR